MWGAFLPGTAWSTCGRCPSPWPSVGAAPHPDRFGLADAAAAYAAADSGAVGKVAIIP